MEIDMSFLKDKKVFIFDMDGTIYLGSIVFDFAVKFINRLREDGRRVIFFTNNSSHNGEFYMEKLTRMGFSPSREEIMTSGDVTIGYLKSHRAGKKVFRPHSLRRSVLFSSVTRSFGCHPRLLFASLNPNKVFAKFTKYL
jgi:hypothetical protein